MAIAKKPQAGKTKTVKHGIDEFKDRMTSPVGIIVTTNKKPSTKKRGK